MDPLNYIAGDWVRPAGDPGADVLDASTGEKLGRQQCSSASQVELALVAAHSVARNVGSAWYNLSSTERVSLLRACADMLDEKFDAMAHIDARQTGVLYRTTLADTRNCSRSFRAAAQLLEDDLNGLEPKGINGSVRVQHLPLGPAAIITPWHSPSSIACHMLASALAAGCPVLFKPSEWAQGSAQVIAETIGPVFPAGVFQMLHGDCRISTALAEDRRISCVSFNGDRLDGQALAIACGRELKPARLALLSNNPLVVLEDADLDRAADGVLSALISLNGQCIKAVGRVLIHESVYSRLLDIIRQRFEKLRIGVAVDAESEVGPVAYSAHRDHLMQRIAALQSEGAELIQAMQCPTGPGWYVPPTLICELGIKHSREILFGPIAFVLPFKTEKEAIMLANDTNSVMAAWVYGSETLATSVANGIQASMICINGASLPGANDAGPQLHSKSSALQYEDVNEACSFFRTKRVLAFAGPGAGN